MEGYCSTGQSPQRAVVPVEEGEDEEEDEEEEEEEDHDDDDALLLYPNVFEPSYCRKT
jgi:ribosomal protein L12E/L44/L45/RPP1/RPP2